jgi:HPt (histidine-containing phosphotransfer) domain-containing protein
MKPSRCLLMMLLLSAAGCAQIEARPSHAHLGHALTSWMHTPGQRGLLVVAREQADAALREAAAAAAAPTPAQRRAHVAKLADALDPEAGNNAAPGAYGVLRALQEAVEHVDYAATSPDASQQVVEAGAEIAAAAGPLLDGLRRAHTLARSAERLGDTELASTASRLDSGLRQLVQGADFNGDGRISLRDGEAGLAQIEQRLQAAAAETLPQRRLFGWVRAPAGQAPSRSASATGSQVHAPYTAEGGH